MRNPSPIEGFSAAMRALPLLTVPERVDNRRGERSATGPSPALALAARAAASVLPMSTGFSLPVQQMLREIDQRYFDPLTLDVLAARLKKDPRHLGRRFRLEIGVSVHEYLVQVRLDHAATAIRRGVKIDAVSLLVGYRSKKNFFSAFKRRFGMTPGAYAAATRRRR